MAIALDLILHSDDQSLKENLKHKLYVVVNKLISLTAIDSTEHADSC